MDSSSRLPGHYPETPHAPPTSAAARYTPQSVGRAGGPIRRHGTQTRARAPSTPYQRPNPQNTPTSGPRQARPEYDDDDDDDERSAGKKSLGEKTAELVGTLVSGVKDWFSNAKTPRREHVQSVVPRKRTPQRSATSRLEEGLDDEVSAELGIITRTHREDNMFSPSLAPHYAGQTPCSHHSAPGNTDFGRWVVKQRTATRVPAPDPPIFPLPNTNPGHKRQDSQGKYATLPSRRSNAALVPTTTTHRRPRQQPSQSSLRQPREWELSKDRFAEQDHETLTWCDKYEIDIVALAHGTQKRPPLPSFQDIQRYEALRNDVAFFERQNIRHRPKPHLRPTTSSYELSRLAQENAALSLPKLLRLKDIRAKADMEAAQLERSRARNGYATVGSSRGSSRTRGGDDVWILPGLHVPLRPGSSGSRRSLRMRTLSPGPQGGSWRSQDSRTSRPRGRDIFPLDEAMTDEPPPPTQDSASMKDVEVVSRRKRPGVFSAREEDLDDLEMDVDIPARKKARLSQVPYGPKFASLWEPSRRENWPLPDDPPHKVDDAGEREMVREELRGLESPAFKLPPSARKEMGSVEEATSPTRDLSNGDVPLITMSPEKSPEPGKAVPVFNLNPPAKDFPKFELPAPAKSPTKVPEPEGSPSKTSEFMKSILGNDEDIPSAPKENGIKAPEDETQSTNPGSQPSQTTGFEFPPLQTTNGTDKPASNGVFSGIKTTFTPPPQTTSPTKETEKPAASPLKFNFGQKPTEPKPEDPKPSTPAFNFGPPPKMENKVGQPAVPAFTAKTESTSSGFGPFGGAFKKSEPEQKSLFPDKPESTPVTEPPKSEPPAPVFGSSAFTFGQPPAPKKESTPPPAPPDVTPEDESMDITDSPPASRINSMTGSDVPSQFPAFPGPAPTSAPAATPVKQGFKFSPVNGTTEKPATSPFKFGAEAENKNSGFQSAFGANPFSGGPNPFSPPAASPPVSAPNLPAFGGFAGFAPKTETGEQKPAGTKVLPSFGAAFGTNAGPAETKALFGQQGTETKPLFGVQTTEAKPVFGQTNPPAITSTESKSPFGFGSTTSTDQKSLFGPTANTPTFADNKSPFGSQPPPAFGATPAPSLFGPPTFPRQPSVTSPPPTAPAPPAVNPFASSTTAPPAFGSAFNFNVPQPGINPFAANTAPTLTTSAPVSPQNQQLPTFPGQPFGTPQQPTTPGGGIFGGAAAGFGGHVPTFNMGADMARSSSDTGAAGTPGRRIAQPRRRRGR